LAEPHSLALQGPRRIPTSNIFGLLVKRFDMSHETDSPEGMGKCRRQVNEACALIDRGYLHGCNFVLA
jgi:hypothetical protein